MLGFYQGTELLIVVGTAHSSVLQRNYKIKPGEPWKKRNGSNSYPEHVHNAQPSAGRGGFITADTMDQLHQSHIMGLATEQGGNLRAQSTPGGSWLAGAGSDHLS